MSNWMPSSLSELTPIISNMELTHLGLEASDYLDCFGCIFLIVIIIRKIE